MPSVRPRAVRGLIPRLRCRVTTGVTQPPNQVLPRAARKFILNSQREFEPAPGRMLICTPLSAVVSPPAANSPRGAANRTGRSAAEPGRGTPAGADPGRRAGGPWLNIRLHPAAHPVLDSRWARCTLRAWSQHEGAAARCSATQSHRIPSAHARPPHTRFAARSI